MRYFIFGAGHCGKVFIENLDKSGMPIAAVIDNSTSKQGTYINKHLVKSAKALEHFEKGQDICLVTTDNAEYRYQITHQLKALGFVQNTDFRFSSEWYDFNYDFRTLDIDLPDGYTVRNSEDKKTIIVLSEEKRIFRFIEKTYEELYVNIYNRIKSANLFGKYIVDTLINRDKFENYNLVFEHEYTWPVSNCAEYPPSMLRAYVLWMLELIAELDKAGVAIAEILPENTCYYQNKFLCFSFGEFDVGKTNFAAILNFIESLMNPLILISKDEMKKAYWYLHKDSPTCTIYDLRGYLSEKDFCAYEQMIDAVYMYCKQGEISYCCTILTEYIETVAEPYLFSAWGEYDNETRVDELNLKYKNSLELIRSVKPSTLIDLAGNSGIIPIVLRNEIESAICADTDLNALNRMWNYLTTADKKHDGAGSTVIPVYLNILAATPALFNSCSTDGLCITPHYPSAYERYKSECAVVLSVLHHLVYKYAVTFEQLIPHLKRFTWKYLLIEWVEREEIAATEHFNGRLYSWYTRNNFEQSLRKHFDIISTKPSGMTTRTLYLCVVKNA